MAISELFMGIESTDPTFDAIDVTYNILLLKLDKLIFTFKLQFIVTYNLLLQLRTAISVVLYSFTLSKLDRN